MNEEQNGGAVKIAEEHKQTIKSLLNDYLNAPIKDNKAMKTIAKQWGISGSKSIKALVVFFCIMNSFKKSDFDDMEKLASLLGEESVGTTTEQEAQESLLRAIKESLKE